VNCKRCILHDDVPGVKVNPATQQCAQCDLYDALSKEYTVEKLEKLIARIKKDGKGKPYDVVVGISGGCDSSWLLVRATQVFGLRVLAVNYDNAGWGTQIATDNMQKMVSGCEVDFLQVRSTREDYDKIVREHLLAGVPDIESVADLGLASVINEAASRFGVKHVFNGHNFRTEGVQPTTLQYMDDKYLQAVCKERGVEIGPSIPRLGMWKQVKWALKGIQRHRPHWYFPYKKSFVKRELTSEFGWEDYGGHHYENLLTKYFHSYFLPTRFGMDQYIFTCAAMCRNGEWSQMEALSEFHSIRDIDPSLEKMVRERLGLSESDFKAAMSAPKKFYTDYDNYQKLFKLTKPMWWLFMKLHRVPKSFYLKMVK